MIYEYKIEKNIPVPAPMSGTKYPFKNMEIGDSFFIPFERVATTKVAGYKYAAANGVKISFRKVEGGARVWRIA